MPNLKTPIDGRSPFGKPMARFRNERGYSQRDLARETGTPQGMIAYHEKQADYPHTQPILSKALRVSVDQLLLREKISTDRNNRDMRLCHRFTQIKKRHAREKPKVIRVLDTFIENHVLRKNQSSNEFSSGRRK